MLGRRVRCALFVGAALVIGAGPLASAQTDSSQPTTTAWPPSPTSTDSAVPSTEPLPVLEPFPAPDAPEPEIRIGRLIIPKLLINEPLYEGMAMVTLDRGVAHAPGSALPGQLGNVVIGGHRVSHRKPFRNIDLLEPGDEVIFMVNDRSFPSNTRWYHYRVTGTEIVDPSEVRVVEQTRAYTATLFACHPPHSTRQRWITHLELVRS